MRTTNKAWLDVKEKAMRLYCVACTAEAGRECTDLTTPRCISSVMSDHYGGVHTRRIHNSACYTPTKQPPRLDSAPWSSFSCPVCGASSQSDCIQVEWETGGMEGIGRIVHHQRLIVAFGLDTEEEC